MKGLAVEDVSLGFGGVQALSSLSFELPAGTISALIGPNGAGKSSLFNCVSGHYIPQTGKLSFGGVDLLGLKPYEVASAGIARTFQDLALFPSLTVLENVQCGGYHLGNAGLAACALRLPTAWKQERESRSSAMEILERLGLVEYAGERPTGLPFGTLKRIEIARALAGSPRLLMLDEPANGLDGAEVDEMATLISELQAERQMSVVLVEHHMGMVMKICEHVVVMDQGRRIAQGDPSTIANDPAVIHAYLGGVQ